MDQQDSGGCSAEAITQPAEADTEAAQHGGHGWLGSWAWRNTGCKWGVVAAKLQGGNRASTPDLRRAAEPRVTPCWVLRCAQTTWGQKSGAVFLLRLCDADCDACVRTMPTSNLLRRIFPLFQSSGGVCARLCYFFLKHLTKFIYEIVWARSSFFF